MNDSFGRVRRSFVAVVLRALRARVVRVEMGPTPNAFIFRRLLAAHSFRISSMALVRIASLEGVALALLVSLHVRVDTRTS